MRDRALTFVIDRDQVVGQGGFLAIRRLHMHNRRGDGSASPGFVCDFVHRPYGQDAVVIVLWHRDATGAIHVLLREGMRPGLAFGRDPARAPLPEPAGDGWLVELPAGIVEAGDVGEVGLRARAVAEALEEGGFAVEPAALVLLGAGTGWWTLDAAIAAAIAGALPDGKTELGLRRLRDHLAGAR